MKLTRRFVMPALLLFTFLCLAACEQVEPLPPFEPAVPVDVFSFYDSQRELVISLGMTKEEIEELLGQELKEEQRELLPGEGETLTPVYLYPVLSGEEASMYTPALLWFDGDGLYRAELRSEFHYLADGSHPRASYKKLDDHWQITKTPMRKWIAVWGIVYFDQDGIPTAEPEQSRAYWMFVNTLGGSIVSSFTLQLNNEAS